MNNQKLNDCKNREDDEFYTLRKDIAFEFTNYKEYFRGKNILCPCDYVSDTPVKFYDEKNGITCDDQDTSEFVKYLVDNAKRLGIKSVSASGFNPHTGEGLPFEKVNLKDFDMVVTNPPFSRFNKFFKKLYDSEKDFLVVGHQMDLSLKDVAQAISEDKVWTGYNTEFSGFLRPDGTMLDSRDYLTKSCQWITNLPVKRNQRPNLIMTRSYKEDPEYYHRYLNFPGIDVPRLKDIPKDYKGYMGVPVTYIKYHNPSQFRIIGESSTLADTFRTREGHNRKDRFYISDGTSTDEYKRMPARFIIQRVDVQKNETSSLSDRIFAKIEMATDTSCNKEANVEKDELGFRSCLRL